MVDCSCIHGQKVSVRLDIHVGTFEIIARAAERRGVDVQELMILSAYLAAKGLSMEKEILMLEKTGELVCVA